MMVVRCVSENGNAVKISERSIDKLFFVAYDKFCAKTDKHAQTKEREREKEMILY